MSADVLVEKRVSPTRHRISDRRRERRVLHLTRRWGHGTEDATRSTNRARNPYGLIAVPW